MWRCSFKANDSFTWKGVASTWENVKGHEFWFVGDGTNFRVWFVKGVDGNKIFSEVVRLFECI